MENFLELFNSYARSELLILVPVLAIINKLIHTSKIHDQFIPMISTIISIILCSIYTFATVPITGLPTFLLATFTALTQGILFSGGGVISMLLLETLPTLKQTNNDAQNTNNTNEKH